MLRPTAIPVCDKINPFWRVVRADSHNWLFPFHHLHYSFLLTWKTWKQKQYQKNEIFTHPHPLLHPYFDVLTSDRARANIQFTPLLFQRRSIKHRLSCVPKASFQLLLNSFQFCINQSLFSARRQMWQFPSQRIYKLNLDTAQWMKIAPKETSG